MSESWHWSIPSFTLSYKAHNVRTPKTPPKEPATLGTLPDVPLRIMLSKVPLQQLICGIPRISQRWSRLQSRVLFAKRHLVLYIGGPDCHRIMILEDCMTVLYGHELRDANGRQMYPTFNLDINRIKLPTLTESAAQKLTFLMPNISALELCLCLIPTPASFDTINAAVKHLLKQWASTLTTLKIRCQFKEFHQAVPPRVAIIISLALVRIIEVVNTLPHLEHLTIDFRDSLGSAKPLDLPVISGLKEFFFRSDDPMSMLFNSLSQYAEGNTKLKIIGLGNPSDTRDMINYFRNCDYRHKIVSLTNVGYPLDRTLNEPLYTRFLSLFPRLETYRILPQMLRNPTTLAYIAKTLSPLTNLQHFNWIMHTSTLRKPPSPLPKLPTIKVLSLMFDTADHSELTFPWAVMFPNVQIVDVYHSSVYFCRKCPIPVLERDNPEQIVRVMRPCSLQLLKPLKQLPKLKKIYYIFNNFLDNMVVFEPADL